MGIDEVTAAGPDATDVTVIVPAFNEVKRIAATIDEIRAYFSSRKLSCQIIVSADGNDGTRERAREIAAIVPKLMVIGSAERGGKGRGIRQAVPLATGRIVGFVDADQKTPIAEFGKIEPLLESGHEVVIGSRGLSSSQIENPQPWYRRLGSRGFGLAMHAIVGLRDVPDTQCGFKFFTANAARELFAAQRIDGYMFDVEILYLATRRGWRIAQVPVRWRDDGDSRLSLVAGNIKNALDLLRIRFGG